MHKCIEGVLFVCVCVGREKPKAEWVGGKQSKALGAVAMLSQSASGINKSALARVLICSKGARQHTESGSVCVCVCVQQQQHTLTEEE